VRMKVMAGVGFSPMPGLAPVAGAAVMKGGTQLGESPRISAFDSETGVQFFPC
jgi:hypothetical protein